MRKAFDIIRTIIVWIVVLSAVAMTVFTFLSLTTVNRNDRAIFGYKIFIVNTDSMEATDFKAGDLIFVKDINPEDLEKGDIITFVSKDENSLDETLTHKIRAVVKDTSGNPGFVTYGTTTNVNDETIVLYDDVLGKYEFHIAGLGTVFNFLKTTQGFFLCIFTPIMLVIIYEIIKFFVLLRKSKKQEMEEIESERAANDKLAEELRVLKAQLEEKQLALSLNQASAADTAKTIKVKLVPAKRTHGKTSQKTKNSAYRN